MINFTGIIKSVSDYNGKARYINTNTIQRIWETDKRGGSQYESEIFFSNKVSEYSRIPAETWAKAILKADKNNEIVDIDEFAKAEENKLDIEG